MDSELARREPQILGGRFALFADCLYIGCFVVVASLPVITAFAAFTAACHLLRQRVARDATVGVRPYAATFAAVLRSHVGVVLVPIAVVAVLLADITAARSGIPGAPVVAILAVVGALAAVLVGLRSAASWAPGRSWQRVVVDAARATLRQPQRSLLLLLAAASAAVIALMTPTMLLLAPGPMVLAAVALTQVEEDR